MIGKAEMLLKDVETLEKCKHLVKKKSKKIHRVDPSIWTITSRLTWDAAMWEMTNKQQQTNELWAQRPARQRGCSDYLCHVFPP